MIALNRLHTALLMFITLPILTTFCHVRLHYHLQAEMYLHEKTAKLITFRMTDLYKTSRFLSQLITNKDDQLDNPLTILVMVRRLAMDWTALASKLSRHLSLFSLDLGEEKWPKEEDVEAAAMGVLTVQLTYNLSTTLLAKGKLDPDGHVVSELAATDCFNIALQFYDLQLYAEASEWLQEAFSKITTGDSTVSRQTVLLYLAPSLCFSEGLKASRFTLVNLMKTRPRGMLLDFTLDEYKDMFTTNCDKLKQIAEKTRKSMWRGRTHWDKFHRQLCRGETIAQDKELRCRYVHHHQSHLRLQPFKLEELQLDPPVLRFYDVITDKEVETLKSEAVQHMEHAQIISDPPRGKEKLTEYRTSHVAWLDSEISVVADTLSQRMEDMTNLDLYFAETNQISRYGVSGEYLPHTDYLGLGTPFEGDRLATLMFYLNEVEQGGHTVFLGWGLSVPPVKNSAVLWFNFLPRGDVDYNSFHSGCPVLQGSKWVLNKWIHNGENFFKFPCTLNRNGSFKYYYL